MKLKPGTIIRFSTAGIMATGKVVMQKKGHRIVDYYPMVSEPSLAVIDERSGVAIMYGEVASIMYARNVWSLNAAHKIAKYVQDLGRCLTLQEIT